MKDKLKHIVSDFINNNTSPCTPSELLLDHITKDSYYYPYQNAELRNSLNAEEHSVKVYSYFKKYDKGYWEAHKRFKSILGNGFFNPYKEYDLIKYFLQSDSYKDLDIIYDFIESPVTRETIAYIGDKGSGKTALINCWIYNNMNNFEKYKILFVRCDGHSLYDLWLDYLTAFRGDDDFDQSKIITIEEYLTINLLYVFCKFCMNSERQFVRDILVLLQQTGPKYEYQLGRTSLHDTRTRSIYDGLLETKQIIERMETGKKESYNYALHNVMKVSGGATHRREKNRWISLSEALSTFLTQNGYWVLRIVDGVDNVHINNDSARPFYEKMLNEAFDFLKRTPNNKYIHLMVMRERTYIECRSRPPMPDTTGYMDVHEIKHKSANFKQILDGRYKYVQKSFKDDSLFSEICGRVCDSIAEAQINRLNHNNARTFLYNRLSLIALVYYRIKQLGGGTQNIDNHIKTFELRNRYLNGRVYLNTIEDWHNLNSEIGLCSMNIFYFNLHNFPCRSPSEWQGLCKTRILQLLRHYHRMTEDQLSYYLTYGFEYNPDLVNQNIADLKAFGMIDTKYDDYIYLEISNKGHDYLDYSFGNIDTLYYFALDSPLPSDLIEGCFINCHNNKLSSRTNYPFAAVSTFLTFMYYLIYVNQLENQKLYHNMPSIEGKYRKPIRNFILPFQEPIPRQKLLSSCISLIENSDLNEVEKIWEFVSLLCL